MKTTINRLGAPLRCNRPWPPREIEDMRQNYHTVGGKGMALRWKRTIGAVRMKAYELGLTRKAPE